MALCSVKNCKNQTRSSGSVFCEKHYYRMRRKGHTSCEREQAKILFSEGKKVCAKCLETKPITHFAKGSRTATGLFSYCNLCRREDNFLRKYHMSLQDYDKMLHIQHGRCAICHRLPDEIVRRAEKYRRLVIDHNHQNGKLRQLLCGECNLALAFFKEDIGILKSAIKYIQKHS